ncbi:hypothetical protein [Propionivibrio sp.]|uniref:hypothetical protein n=1 Tax=Propionivibrio sp. TaxID=2212460 RepID=UPI00260338A6|nr:hypothetical protein [Propionivibrio sp.]
MNFTWVTKMDIEVKNGVGKDESVAVRLKQHPELKERMERLLDDIENVSGDVRQSKKRYSETARSAKFGYKSRPAMPKKAVNYADRSRVRKKFPAGATRSDCSGPSLILVLMCLSAGCGRRFGNTMASPSRQRRWS